MLPRVLWWFGTSWDSAIAFDQFAAAGEVAPDEFAAFVITRGLVYSSTPAAGLAKLVAASATPLELTAEEALKGIFWELFDRLGGPSRPTRLTEAALAPLARTLQCTQVGLMDLVAVEQREATVHQFIEAVDRLCRLAFGKLDSSGNHLLTMCQLIRADMQALDS